MSTRGKTVIINIIRSLFIKKTPRNGQTNMTGFSNMNQHGTTWIWDRYPISFLVYIRWRNVILDRYPCPSHWCFNLSLFSDQSRYGIKRGTLYELLEHCWGRLEQKRCWKKGVWHPRQRKHPMQSHIDRLHKQRRWVIGIQIETR